MSKTSVSRRRRGGVLRAVLAAAAVLGVGGVAAGSAPPAAAATTFTPLDFTATDINHDGAWVAGSGFWTDGLHQRSYPVRQATSGGSVESAAHGGSHGFLGVGSAMFTYEVSSIYQVRVWEPNGEANAVAGLPAPCCFATGRIYTTADRSVIGFTQTALNDLSHRSAAVYFAAEDRVVPLGSGPSRLIGLTAETATYVALAPNGGPVRVDLRTGAETNLHPALTTGQTNVHLLTTSSQRYLIATVGGAANALYDLDNPRLIALPTEFAGAAVVAVGGDVAWLQHSANGTCTNHFWRIGTDAASSLPGCFESPLLSGDGAVAVGVADGGSASVAFAVPALPSPVAAGGRVCFTATGSPGDIAVINLTPVLAGGHGNGQLVSSDTTNPPIASNVNYGPDTVDPNIALAPIGTDGNVCYVNSQHSTVHLIADQLATLDDTTATPTNNTRLLDTRNAS